MLHWQSFAQNNTCQPCTESDFYKTEYWDKKHATGNFLASYAHEFQTPAAVRIKIFQPGTLRVNLFLLEHETNSVMCPRGFDWVQQLHCKTAMCWSPILQGPVTLVYVRHTSRVTHISPRTTHSIIHRDPICTSSFACYLCIIGERQLERRHCWSRNHIFRKYVALFCQTKHGMVEIIK